jgi:hypothetical protein
MRTIRFYAGYVVKGQKNATITSTVSADSIIELEELAKAVRARWRRVEDVKSVRFGIVQMTIEEDFGHALRTINYYRPKKK